MRPVVPTLLAAMLMAVEPDAGNQVIIEEPGLMLEALEAGAFGRMYALGGAALRNQLARQLPAAWQARGWDGLRADLTTLRWAEISGTATDRAVLATRDGGAAAWTLLAGGEAAGTTHLGDWHVERTGDLVTLSHGADPGPSPLTAQGRPGLHLRADLSRTSTGPSGLPAGSRLSLDIIACPDGLAETWKLDAVPLPVRPLARQDLAWRPADAIAWGAIGIDGPGLQRLLATASRQSAARRLHDLIETQPADGLDADALSGTWSWSVVSAVPLPALILRTPPAAGAAIAGLLRTQGIDPAQAENDALLLPWNAGPMPIAVRRIGDAWFASNDLPSLTALAGSVADEVAPPQGCWLASGCDGPRLMRMIGGFLPLATRGQPAERAEILRAASGWLMRAAASAPPAHLRLMAMPDGSHGGTGLNSLATLMVPLVVGSMLEDPLRVAVNRIRQERLMRAVQGLAPGAAPTACCCRQGGGAGHWWTLETPPGALPEMPRWVLAPDGCPGADQLLLVRADGSRQVMYGPDADACAKLMLALRLRIAAGGATVRDWLPVLQAVRGFDGPAATYASERNCRVLDLGMGWTRLPKGPNLPTETLVAFSRGTPESFALVIAEKHTGGLYANAQQVIEAMAMLLRQSMPAAVVVAEGPTRVAGLPAAWRRWRLPAADGKSPIIRDDVALLTTTGIYQLLSTTRESDGGADAVRDGLIAKFALLDASVLAPDQPPPITQLTAPGGSWHLPLPDGAWSSSPAIAAQSGWAQAAARSDDLLVIAGSWPIDGEISDEAAASALFGMIEEGWPRQPFSNPRKFAAGGATGTRTRMDRTIGTSAFTYRLAAIRHGGGLTLVMAWGPATGGPALAARLEALIDSWQADPGGIAAGTGAPATRAAICNRLGLHAASLKRMTEALGRYEAANALEPGNVDYLQNAVSAMHQLKRSADALRLLEQAGPAATAHLDLASWHAYLLSEVGRNDDSLRAWKAVFDAGSANVGDFKLWIELLWRLDRQEEALAAFEQHPAAGLTRDGWLYRAELLCRAGRPEEAATGLAGWAAAHPDPAVDLAISSAWRDAGDAIQALSACTRALASPQVDAAEAQREIGECHWQLGDLRKSREAFAAASEADPGDSHARAMIVRIDGLLGSNERAALRWGDAIPAVRPSGNADASRPPGWASGHDAAWVSRTWSGEAADGAPARWTRSDRLHVFTAAGAADAASWSFPFDSGWQEMCINRLAVLSPEGEVLDEADQQDAWVEDAGDGGQGGTKRIARVPLQGVRPGSDVVVEITWRAPGSLGSLPFHRVDLSPRWPVLRSRVFVRSGQGDRLLATGCPLGGEADGWTWAGADAWPGWRFEPFTIDDSRWSPNVDVAGPAGSWEAAGASYLESLRGLAGDVPASLAELARTRTAGLPKEQAATVLADLVQSETGYVAIEFGRRGKIPDAAERTRERRMGDCKDHAVLLQALLKAAGIPAFLALCGGENIARDLPDLDQFDHMVVAIPGDGGTWRLIDTTDKSADCALPVPAGLDDRDVLVLDPAGPRLVRTGPLAPSKVSVLRTVTVAADGGMEVSEEVSMSDHFASHLRERLRSQPVAEHRRILQELMDRSAGEVLSVEADGSQDKHAPLRLRIAYRPNSKLRVAADRIEGVVPDPWGVDYFAGDPCPDRRSPFTIRYPLAYALTLVIQPPPGMQVDLPGSAADETSAGIAWRLADDATGRRCMTAALTSGTWPAEGYAAFCRRLAFVREQLAQPVTLRRR